MQALGDYQGRYVPKYDIDKGRGRRIHQLFVGSAFSSISPNALLVERTRHSFLCETETGDHINLSKRLGRTKRSSTCFPSHGLPFWEVLFNTACVNSKVPSNTTEFLFLLIPIRPTKRQFS